MSEHYCGWANYATWRVNLEFFDGVNPYERYGEDSFSDAYDLAVILLNDVSGILEAECNYLPNSRALALALHFVDDVDFRQIAAEMIETYGPVTTEDELSAYASINTDI